MGRELGGTQKGSGGGHRYDTHLQVQIAEVQRERLWSAGGDEGGENAISSGSAVSLGTPRDEKAALADKDGRPGCRPGSAWLLRTVEVSDASTEAWDLDPPPPILQQGGPASEPKANWPIRCPAQSCGLGCHLQSHRALSGER